jgi:UDP-N-acetylglucosamine--N-acetylmuramyl-(pentapeptide) pyrophosphoryl-undecaprenol N-acetylglucosamine transferase
LHQQDVLPGLANKLCQLFAKKITVTFEESLKYFPSSLGIFYKKFRADKIVLTGNPCFVNSREMSNEDVLKEFKLDRKLPTLLVLGGGTGAEFLNSIVQNSLPQLTKTVQIIHSMGKGKQVLPSEVYENYHPYEFISNMSAAYTAADIVLARAGLSTITELSYLKKLSIIVPMPNSHQEINAMLLYSLKAAIVIPQSALNPEGLTRLVRRLLFEPKLQENLKENIGKIMPRGASKKIAEIVVLLAEKKL